MLRRFFDRYEDTANQAPWDGKDKEYVFVWGGPYDSNDEIQDRTGSIVPYEVMEPVISDLHRDVGDEWAPIEHEGVDYDARSNLFPRCCDFGKPLPTIDAARRRIAGARFVCRKRRSRHRARRQSSGFRTKRIRCRRRRRAYSGFSSAFASIRSPIVSLPHAFSASPAPRMSRASLFCPIFHLPTSRVMSICRPTIDCSIVSM